MKILYLSSDPGIDLAGQSGGSIHIRAFVRAMADLGHRITVVSTTANSDKNLEADLRAEVRPAPLAPWNRRFAGASQAANRVAGRNGRVHPDLVRVLHNLTFAKVARAAAREIVPNFIYERYSLWGTSGLGPAKDCAAPLVLEVNAPLVYEQQEYRGLTFPTLARQIERMIWRRADLVVAVSESLRKHLQGAGVRPERILTLPNAVDPGLFHMDIDSEPVRRRFNLDGRFVIGFVGSFKPWHGVHLLLAAFHELHQANPSSHLLLVGDGPLRAPLEEEAQKAGLKEAVTFAGAVPHEEMPRYLAAMDVAVAPYPALDEFYYSPLKIFEYMAAGRAVIASRVGQVAEVIVDGASGLLFEPGDRLGLVSCIRRLQHDQALRQELGRKAREACRAYTWSSNAARVINRVERLIRREQSAVREEEGSLEQPGIV